MLVGSWWLSYSHRGDKTRVPHEDDALRSQTTSQDGGRRGVGARLYFVGVLRHREVWSG